MPHSPGKGAIFGIVSEDGIVKDSTPVYLYDMRRDLGVGEKKLLAKRFTRADGGFEFAGLDDSYADYMLMTTDEDGVAPKNALIQDRVQPIAAHVGTGDYLWEQLLRLRSCGGGVFGSTENPAVLLGVWNDAHNRDGLCTTAPILPGFSSRAPFPAIVLHRDSYLVSRTSGQFTYTGPGDEHYSQNTSASSLEFVVDLDSHDPATTPLRVGYFDSYPNEGDTGAYYNVFVATVDFTNNTMTVSNAVQTVATVDITAYTGAAHIVVVWTHAVDVRTYIDGVLVDTTTTTAIPKHDSGNIGNKHSPQVVGAGGTDNTFVPLGGCACTVANVAFYLHGFTAAEVVQQYESLFGTTNYVSELPAPYVPWVQHEPFAFFEPLDSYISGSLSFDGLFMYTYNNNKGFSTPTTTSLSATGPLAGRQAIKVNTDSFQGIVAGSNSIGNSGYTYCGWLRVDGVADKSILEYHMGRSATYEVFGISLAAGVFSARILLASNSLHTMNFSAYAVPDATFLFVALMVKADGTNELYIGDETTAPVRVDVKADGTLNFKTDIDLFHGSTSFDAPSSLSNYHYNGRLVLFPDNTFGPQALYATQLTPARVQELWAAKDVV